MWLIVAETKSELSVANLNWNSIYVRPRESTVVILWREKREYGHGRGDLGSGYRERIWDMGDDMERGHGGAQGKGVGWCSS